MAGKRWSADEKKKLIELRNSGMSVDDMAKALGRSISSIKGALYVHVQGVTTPTLITPKNKTAVRKCLACHRPFKSSGVGNRICERCKINRRDFGVYSNATIL